MSKNNMCDSLASSACSNYESSLFSSTKQPNCVTIRTSKLRPDYPQYKDKMPCFEVSSYITNPPVLQVPHTTQEQSHGYFGLDSPDLVQSFGKWCSSIGVIGDATAHFDALLTHARTEYFRPEQTCLWLETRITHSNDHYVIPRPHHDGRYWDESLNEGKEVFKVGACLVGPGTLFWDAHEGDTKAHWIVTEGQREKLKKEGLDQHGMEMRKWAADELEQTGVGKVQPGTGQAVRWIVGSSTKAAIHSEPDMSDMPDGRIFVSILPGTEAQIRRLSENWERTFQEKP